MQIQKILVGSLVCITLTGCHMLPGNAEYFQKKVKAVPVLAAQPPLVEAQKQAAAFVDVKIDEAKLAAATTFADVSVQVPLAEAATVSGPLVTSIGPPTKSWTGAALKLAAEVNAETAALDKKIAKYAEKTSPLVGKAVEGTGLFQIGFFTQWALVLGVLAFGYAALKAYGMFNPMVGAGTHVAERVGSKVVGTALHQLVKGGESFLSAVKPAVSYTGDEIKKLFVANHRQEQDSHVQDLVQRLTAAA